MESGAKGCEVIVSGKLRAARAKSMKFKDGYMVSSGDPVRVYLDSSVRHVLLRQGVLGIKVGFAGWQRLCKRWSHSVASRALHGVVRSGAAAGTRADDEFAHVLAGRWAVPMLIESVIVEHPGWLQQLLVQWRRPARGPTLLRCA